MHKCRACLVKCEEDQASHVNLLDKLPIEFLEVSIAEALSEIACIAISPDLHQPSKICSSCLYRLQDAYIFIKKVQESAAIIQQCSSIEYPLPTHPSMLYDVTFENNGETESDSLKVVKHMKIYNVPVELPQSSLEPVKRGEGLSQNALYKEQSTEDPIPISDNVENDEGIINCACRKFRKANRISDETKSIIQEKIFNMQDFEKNLYIKSLLHICECEADATDSNNSKQLEKIIYTLEFKENFVSVSREMFIQVLSLKLRMLRMLENLVRITKNNEQNMNSTSEKSIQQEIDEWARKRDLANARMQKYRQRKFGLSDPLFSLSQSDFMKDEEEKRKQQLKAAKVQRRKELTRERLKRYRQKKLFKALESLIREPEAQNEPVSDEMKQADLERAQRRKELARERSRRYRHRKRINNLETADHWIYDSQVPGPSYGTPEQLEPLVQKEPGTDEM